MENRFTIRDAEEGDIPALAVLMTALGYATTEVEMSVRFKALSGDPSYKTFVALEGEEIAGMAGTHKGLYYELNGSYIRILALVTSAQHRRSGVGKRW